LPRQILVTGAAGFIGSHLTDRLLDLGKEVVGFDNLSSGDRANLAHALANPSFRFSEGDLLDVEATGRVLGQCDLVFHLAADPEVRAGEENPSSHFRQNLLATFNLLEAIRKGGAPTRLIFASTSTVYGEASVIPTPEDYGPLLPISTYGATKLGCEALAASYTELLPLQVVIFRFANIVGARSKHGVIYDFITKLRSNTQELEVLGDGTQTKSYLHVDDCVDAFLMPLEDGFCTSRIQVYNIGSEDQTNVLRIAQVVLDAIGLKNLPVRTTGKPGRRAWPGDVGAMQLDISRIKERGWMPNRNSDESVRLAAQQIVREFQNSS
jgi:UDP-glucose 4-epimerase